MKQRDRLVLTCSCEGTMPVDGDAIAASGCGELPETPASALSHATRPFPRGACHGAPDDGHLHPGNSPSSRKSPQISRRPPQKKEAGDAYAPEPDISFVNIRETAGWSHDAQAAGPKMGGADRAGGEREAEPFEVVSMESRGGPR